MSKKRTRSDARAESERDAEAAGLPPAVENATAAGRRSSQRAVAERRAPHFARPDAVTNGTEEATSSRQEQWPGPFSTAMRMIEDRETAKLSRENAIMLRHSYGDSADEINQDTYDIMLKDARNAYESNPVMQKMPTATTIPTLVDLSVVVVAEHFEHVDDLGLLPQNVRSSIALEVSKRRKLNVKALMALVPEATPSIIIPDCSSIDEAGMLLCLQNSVLLGKEPGFKNTLDTQALQVVSLHNCGGAFTDSICALLLPVSEDLEVLCLKGCYKLNDSSLAALLMSTRKLRSLDISNSLRLGHCCLSATASLHHLTSLCLDNMGHLQDSDVETLLTPSMQNLNELSLEGLCKLTNKSVIQLTQLCARNLHSLSVKGCLNLDGTFLRSLQAYNLSLMALNISFLPKLTTADLLMHFSSSYEHEEQVKSHFKSSRAEYKEIDVSGLSGLVDDIVIEMCVSNSNSLRKLSLNSAPNLTGRALMGIVKHCCKVFTELNISFIRSIQEYAAMALVRESICLEKMEVWGCSQLKHNFFNLCISRNVSLIGYLHKNE